MYINDHRPLRCSINFIRQKAILFILWTLMNSAIIVSTDLSDEADSGQRPRPISLCSRFTGLQVYNGTEAFSHKGLTEQPAN